MRKHLFLSLFLLVFLLQAKSQTFDTLIICNGDSALLYNNWETQNGNYTDGVNVTTLIVNPTPSITGSFILNGNATQPIPDTYDLTQAIGNQSGSAWNSVTLDLTQPFSFDVDMFFGYNDFGADGIAFLLQQVSTSVGTSGGGIGYEGITPSFGVEFDTWQNGNRNDPIFDHIAIQKNGDLNHAGINNLFPATGFPPGNINIEDGLWHNVVFSWDPSVFNFTVVFDGILLINYTGNIVANIFGNNPNVYWGFTAATGGANNLQRFRVNSLGIQLSDMTICATDTIQVDPQVSTTSYSYLWTPNYNIIDNTLSSPFIFPDSTTVYSLELTNSYGCSFSDSMTVFVDLPTSSLVSMTVCDSYLWPVDGNTYTSSGLYIQSSTNSVGCAHVDSLNLTISSTPSVSINSPTICSGNVIMVATPAPTGVYDYNWTVPAGATNPGNVASFSANIAGNYTVIVSAITSPSCPSNPAIGVLTITQPPPPTGLACYETAILDSVTCTWSVIGNMPSEPTNLACYQTSVWNPITCIWDIIGTQPPPPIIECYETAIFDSIDCTWSTESQAISVDFTALSPICRYDESTLFIHISNSLSNTYAITLQDSILKSFIIDTNGLLIPEAVPITLTPNFSGEVYIISLTNEQGCTQYFNDFVHIEVKQPPELSLNEDDICFGEASYTLNSATPFGGTYFIDGVMTNYFDVENLDFGDYIIRYEYTDPITSCSNQITKTITINDPPEAGMFFTPQPTNIENAEIFFMDDSNEEILESEWHLGDGTIIYDKLSFSHTYNDTGTYTVRYYITNMYECIDSVVNQLVINPIYSIFIPDAFTPNEDGINDLFFPSVIGYNSYRIQVFNQWGGIIYDEENGEWDGKINDNFIPAGTYSYLISVFDFNERLYTYPGVLTLVR